MILGRDSYIPKDSVGEEFAVMDQKGVLNCLQISLFVMFSISHDTEI